MLRCYQEPFPKHTRRILLGEPCPLPGPGLHQTHGGAGGQRAQRVAVPLGGPDGVGRDEGVGADNVALLHLVSRYRSH